MVATCGDVLAGPSVLDILRYVKIVALDVSNAKYIRHGIFDTLWLLLMLFGLYTLRIYEYTDFHLQNVLEC